MTLYKNLYILISAPIPHLRRRGSCPTSINPNAPTLSTQSSTDSMASSGLLMKGLSTGLALSAVNPGCYRLRHTSFRLDRLKSQISEVFSSFSQQRQQREKQREASASTSQFQVPSTRSRRQSLQHQQQQSHNSSISVKLRSRRRRIKLVSPPTSSVATRKRILESVEQTMERKEIKEEQHPEKRRRLSARISARLASSEKEQTSAQSSGYTTAKGKLKHL